jgi:hypothetical protein
VPPFGAVIGLSPVGRAKPFTNCDTPGWIVLLKGQTRPTDEKSHKSRLVHGHGDEEHLQVNTGQGRTQPVCGWLWVVLIHSGLDVEVFICLNGIFSMSPFVLGGRYKLTCKESEKPCTYFIVPVADGHHFPWNSIFVVAEKNNTHM